ncbi:PucR family transcriptional regulator [Rhodococcus opacus]|uniref:PucR family transcriptional regulator n=1 Tax=Rhodococcus opacus TaxID=37919 RepID=UPI000B3402A1|nr:helix-turn-helix domain-containing protein [Rhodococcus opacus]
MSEEVGDFIPAVAREMLSRRDEFIGDLLSVTRSQIHALNLDPRLRGLLEASVTENIVAAVHFLENDTPEEDLEAPTAAIVYARTLAQRDVPLSALIRAYRIGHARFLDASMRYAVEMDGGSSSATIIRLVNRSAQYIDRVCEQVGLAYEQERDRWVGSRSGLRQQWVAQLLDGAVTDIRQAEEALDYSLTGTHVGVDAWADPTVSPHEAVTVLDQLRSLLFPVLGAVGRPLMVPTDEREVRMWFSVAGTAEIDVDRIAKVLAGASLPVQVAVGCPESGVEGFRRSLKQADRVREIAMASGAGPRVISYSQVASIALMVGDLDAVRRFVIGCLGDLAVDDDRNMWLRETLRVFLSKNRSFAAAAESMTLHRNTIQYRVQQAMDLSGHNFDDGERTLDVQLALQAARWLGSAVLRAPNAGEGGGVTVGRVGGRRGRRRG